VSRLCAHASVGSWDRLFRCSSLPAFFLASLATLTISPVGGARAASAETAAREAADAPALEEVVVTAQFYKEDLQTTPIAITVVSAVTMEQRNMTNLTDVSKAAPNVELYVGGSGVGKAAQAFIRGVGQDDFDFALEPGVGVYIDDVYHSTLFGTVIELLDLDRVEVLRGPQGTLFGKNSIGGALRLISNRPEGTGRGYIEVTAGNFDRRDVRAMVDLSLIANVLYLRLSGVSKERDGYVEQLDFGCVHPDLGGIVNPNAPLLPLLTGSHSSSASCITAMLGDERVRAGRAALRWLASDTLEVNFVADVMDDKSGAPAQVLVAVNTNASDPNNLLPGFNANVAIPLYGIPYDNRFLTGSIYQTYSNLNNLVHIGPGSPPTYVPATVTGITSSPPADGVDAYGFSATIDWSPTRLVSLRSITAYRGYSGISSDDVDSSPINVATESNVLDHYQFSEEIRLQGTSFGQRLEWTGGVFYFHGFNLQRGPVDLPVLTWFAPSLDFTQNDPSHITDRAAYAQATYRATDQLSVTTGLRHTDEDKDYTFSHTSYVAGVPDLIPATMTAVSYSRTNWRTAIDYRWTDDLMTYMSASTGFRAGGFNPRPFDSAQVTPFGPETLTSYEVGAKSEWFGRRLRVNVAGFFSRYEDLQTDIDTIDATGLPFFKPVNLGRALIKGGELELEAKPTANLTISGAYGLQRGEFTELGNAVGCAYVVNPIHPPSPDANCTVGGPSLGSPLTDLPERTANVSAQYLIHLAGSSTLTPYVAANYQSTASFDAVGSEQAEIGARTLIDARVTWESANRNWSAALSGTNLTNKQYFINKRDLYEVYGMTEGQPGRPREWAITLRRALH
jgi:iron complex outermembrane receptor protein